MTVVAVDVPRLYRRALASRHRFDGAFVLELRDAARGAPATLVTELERIVTGTSPARVYPAWLLARHVENALASTPGIDQAIAALRLALRPPLPATATNMPFVFDQAARQRWILARIAVRQPPDVALELLERFEERAEAAAMLAALTQELITRNRVRPADHAVVQRLLREMRGSGSPFAWLPTEPHAIEVEAVHPAIDESLLGPPPVLPPLNEPDAPLQGWLWGSQTLYELATPAVGNIAWPRPGTQLELRAFGLPPDGDDGTTASVLACLPLASIAPPPIAMRVRPQSPAQAFALLFQIAALDDGWASGFAAWPRLVAWKLVAALCGKDDGDSPAVVEKAASAFEWTRAAVRGGWFGQVDLGWAALVAAREKTARRIRVLAAARVEPRT